VREKTEAPEQVETPLAHASACRECMIEKGKTNEDREKKIMS
jgi:hypothetical protein